MTIAAVTTFNKDGYEKYGKRMIETFLDYWPVTVPLHLYTEGFTYPGDSIAQVDLHSVSPELVAFKRRNSHRKPPNFRYDAIRFAHKVFAVIHAATTLKVDRLFWLDGDTVTFKHIPVDKLEQWLPDGYYTSCLLRKRRYTECSFVGYRVSNQINSKFMSRWLDYYRNDTVYGLNEFHDCESYDAVRKFLESKGRIKTYNLSGKFDTTGHPFVNCELGAYMDHLKGDRKDDGRSRESDLKTKRTEDYWKQ